MNLYKGSDVLFTRFVTDSEIKEALAFVFNVDGGQVSLWREPEELLDLKSQVLCQIIPISGEFVLMISISCALQMNIEDPLEPMQLLAAKLNTSCLIPDELDNPYTFLLILPDGSIKSVSLDDDAYAEDRYALSKSIRGENAS